MQYHVRNYQCGTPKSLAIAKSVAQICRRVKQPRFIGWSQAELFKYYKASSSLRNLQCVLKAPRWQQYLPGHRPLTHRVIISTITAAHPQHTNHVCRLCCSQALWTEKQRAQLDSASEARCSAVQSMAPFRVLPPHTKPDKENQLKDRITPHVTNFFRLRLTIEKQEGKRKYKSDGAVMVGEFVCMYVCSCTVSE